MDDTGIERYSLRDFTGASPIRDRRSARARRGGLLCAPARRAADRRGSHFSARRSASRAPGQEHQLSPRIRFDSAVRGRPRSDAKGRARAAHSRPTRRGFLASVPARLCRPLDDGNHELPLDRGTGPQSRPRSSNELVHIDAGAYGATNGARILRFLREHPSEPRSRPGNQRRFNALMGRHAELWSAAKGGKSKYPCKSRRSTICSAASSGRFRRCTRSPASRIPRRTIARCAASTTT